MNQKIVLVLSLMLFVASCNSENKMKSDVLFVSLRGENREGFDPTRGWGSYGSSLFYSTLLKYNNSLKIVNDLATSVKVSADRLAWDITIRKDVRFSDGSPLTAEDVAYTFTEAKKSGGKVDLTMLKKAVVKDTYRVIFILNKPWLTFNHRLATVGIVSMKIHQKDKKGFSRKPMGSGPYSMVDWSEGQQLVVEANNYYYGQKPHIKKVVFLFMNDDAAFAAAKAGRLHAVVLPHHFAKQKISNMTIHPVKSVDNRGIVFPMAPDEGKKTEEGYPIGNNVTSDIYIRKALNYAVNRKLMVRTILEGYGEPAYGVVDLLRWNNRAVGIKDNDLKKARQILEEGGWKDSNKDGILEKNGINAAFTVVYFANDIIRQYLATAFKDTAEKIGIEVTVLGKSSEDVKRMQYSCCVLFGFGSYSPEEMYNLYHSKNRGKGFFNPGLYKNTRVDFYMDRAMASATMDESIEWWQKAQWDGRTGLSLKGDAPWVWLVNLSHLYFISDRLDVGTSSMEPHGHGWPLTANIVQWKWKR